MPICQKHTASPYIVCFHFSRCIPRGLASACEFPATLISHIEMYRNTESDYRVAIHSPHEFEKKSKYIAGVSWTG